MSRPDRTSSPFLALSAHERAAIERKLGLPYAPERLALLDDAARAFVDQGRAFVEITSGEGFETAERLEPSAVRAALVLTYSGSLLLAGAPEPPERRRRFVYQSIDASEPPREGTFRLIEPIRVDHAVVGSRLKTSPVRALSVSIGVRDFDVGKRTLGQLTSTLGGILSTRAPAVDVGGVRSVFVQDERLRRKNADLASDMRRAEDELAALLGRLVESRIQDDPLEAEAIGLVLYVTKLAIERGLPAHPTERVRVFETAAGEACALEKKAIEIHRPGSVKRRVEGGVVAGGEIVAGAPVAIVDATGRLVAVLGRVQRITPR